MKGNQNNAYVHKYIYECFSMKFYIVHWYILVLIAGLK